ncbi:MAG: hydantoinase/oxoprolinase family protein [Steroidobacteraceae bacterium]|nr:hydantoinase/oxoprolinase family protein [Deltaproteobacteria bacterium]
MDLAIGIDTGGTFTDGVIVDLETGRVISKAKALTTREDLKIGIEQTFRGLDNALFPQIRLVSLSTTLATNSIVEGKGSRVGLLAAVPYPETFSFPGRMPADQIAVVAGSFDNCGRVAIELDLAAADQAIRRMVGKVDAFAVSGYFSIYNAGHELKLRKLIAGHSGLPVVCGHELSGAVGLVERAVTAALNARLLPVIRELLDAVRHILAAHAIHAPIIVVKGDGSLIAEEIARERPVETVLSGPAASIAGACRLTGLADAIVVDMGGTTTDIGIVKGGMIATTEAGALVGGWQTRVHAVDMWTVGLGGDSKISVEPDGTCRIGPRRAIPLCAAAAKHPALLESLQELMSASDRKSADAGLDFYTLVKRPAFVLSKYEQMLVDLLDGMVVHRKRLTEEIGPFVAIERFVELGYLAEVTFTPTDLMHARGELQLWERDAAEYGACLLARQAGMALEDLLELLHQEITASLTLQIAAKALHEDGDIARDWSAATETFLRRLLRLSDAQGVCAAISLATPVIAVGAPVQAYFPAAAAALDARLIIPEHAEVANAFGAVTGRVVERCELHVRPARPDGFAVAAADVQRTFATLDEAITFAEEYARNSAQAGAKKRGGDELVVSIEREEQLLPLKTGWGDRVLIEVRIRATAVGKPRHS